MEAKNTQADDDRNLSALGRWRIRQNISLSDLAQKTGISTVSLSRYCNGHRVPRERDVLAKIEQVTDGAVTAQQMMMGAE